MNIVQISATYPPHLGGMENVVREISERLVLKKNNVFVITSNIGAKKKHLKSSRNLQLNYLSSFEIAHTPIIPSLFFQLLKVEKKSIVHLHIAQAFTPEIVFLASLMGNYSYIAHIHADVGPSGMMGFLLPIYKKFILQYVLRRATKVICLSDHYKGELIEKYKLDTERIVVIPNGVNDEFLLTEWKEREYKKVINILYVGRLVRQKNVDNLINCLRYLKHNCCIHIVGDGELATELKKLSSNFHRDKIKFYGSVYGSKLINLYRQSDMLVLPSENESLSQVIMEALASKLPVIAMNTPIFREYYSDCISFFQENDPAMLASSIDHLIENEKIRKDLTLIGFIKIQQFSWDKILQKIQKLYLQIT